MPKIYRTQPDGNIVEIVNWNYRSTKGDEAILGRRLTDRETEVFRRLKSEDYSDYEIWNCINNLNVAPKASTTLTFELRSLNKNQLLALIEKYLNQKMPTLLRASKEDLLKLSRQLLEGKNIALV